MPSIGWKSEFVEERPVALLRHIDKTIKGNHFDVGVHIVFVAEIPLPIGSPFEIVMNSAALFK